MQNILVPTDFSAVSKNAALYAISFAKACRVPKITLYNAYQAPVIAEPAIPALQIIDFDELKQISLSGLNHLKAALQTLSDGVVEIDILSDYGILNTGINDICRQHKIDLVIMGISGGSDVEEVLIGSAATNVAHHISTPVIIVPGNVNYRPVKEVVLACDFKKVDAVLPVVEIKKILNETGARLHIVYIDENKRKAEDMVSQKHLLESMFADYPPAFDFIHNENFIDGINQFASKIDANLVIIIPKHHTFFEGLFKRSHTKHLAFHTTLPLMCIHGQKD